MGRKIIYAALILASLGGYVMFDGAVLLAAACFLFLLGAVLLVTLRIQKAGCWMEAVREKDTAVQGERAEASFRFINRSAFPVARALVQFRFSDNRVPSDAESRKTEIQAKSRSELQISCKVSSEHSGVRTVRVEKIQLYDFLQIFSCRISPPQPVEVYILPPLHQVEVAVKEQWSDGGSEETDDTRKGDDPSVISQIREYQPGDSMRGIHWKLSARMGQWMVREYGRTVSRPKVLLRLDDRPNGTADPAQLDGFYAAAASLMYTFCRAKIPCETVWTEGNGERSFPVSSEEELYETLRQLVKSKGAEKRRVDSVPGRNFRSRYADNDENGKPSSGGDGETPGIRWEQRKELRLDIERKLWDGKRCVTEFSPADADDGKWEMLKIEL